MVNFSDTKLSFSDRVSNFISPTPTAPKDAGTKAAAMEKGHRVHKWQLDKWDRSQKILSFDRETNELVLSKMGKMEKTAKRVLALDIRTIVEAHTASYKTGIIRIEDKWKNKQFQKYSGDLILDISYGTSFTPSHWILRCKLVSGNFRRFAKNPVTRFTFQSKPKIFANYGAKDWSTWFWSQNTCPKTCKWKNGSKNNSKSFQLKMMSNFLNKLNLNKIAEFQNHP